MHVHQLAVSPGLKSFRLCAEEIKTRDWFLLQVLKLLVFYGGVFRSYFPELCFDWSYSIPGEQAMQAKALNAIARGQFDFIQCPFDLKWALPFKD